MLKKSILRNSRGMAVFEMIPILVILILLLNFSLGFFGAIHTGIKQSIAARNYAFETYRHRADLHYFNPVSDEVFSYDQFKVRFHAVTSAKSRSVRFIASSRPVDRFEAQQAVDQGTSSGQDHTVKVQELSDSKRNENISVNPIWIKTGYGMCLNAACEPQN